MESKMFTEEELNNMQGLKRGENYIQVLCGCTSKKYGDYVGKLKVFENGQFVIDCACVDACSEKNLTPYDFEKHSQREGNRKWKSHIWVLLNNKKVPLCKTVLIRYFKHASNQVSTSCRSRRTFHRDEFKSCKLCKKERRFHLRTKEDHIAYHNAFDDEDWRCVKKLYDNITCSDPEERESRRNNRGCPRKRACKGCKTCICSGCLKCRFPDCNCGFCVEFMQTAEP